MRKPLGKIDVSVLEGLWGWEAYLAGSGATEDSDDISLIPGEAPTDENLLLNVALGLSNPLHPGCELEIHREGEVPVAYTWKGKDPLDHTGWEKT